MTRNTGFSEALTFGFGIVIMCDHCRSTIDILVGRHKKDFLGGHIYNTEGSQVCWRCKKEYEDRKLQEVRQAGAGDPVVQQGLQAGVG